MSAGGEIETHEGIARLQQREKHGLIGLAAGIRLHIGEFAIEQTADALDREVLDDVDELAAAVIALARIAFGIFVGQHRALGFEHGLGDDVFRCDQLDLIALAAEFLADRVEDFGIDLGEARRKKRILNRMSAGSGIGLGHARRPKLISGEQDLRARRAP